MYVGYMWVCGQFGLLVSMLLGEIICVFVDVCVITQTCDLE